MKANIRMLQMNLATRPFYNERIVHLLVALAGTVVLAITVYNATQVISLSREHTQLAAVADRDEARSGELEREATTIRRDIDDAQLQDLAIAAKEANAIIDQRTFSWTELFNRIETTLPGEVMITSVRPSVTVEGISLSLVVVARRVEDIDTFMERLEGTGGFAGLLSRQEEVTDQGMYKAVLQGMYVPAVSDAARQGN